MVVKRVSIGNFALGGRPGVAAILDRVHADDVLSALNGRGADLIEMRYDLIGGNAGDTAAYTERVRAQTGLPLIGTLRETKRNRAKRLEMFTGLLPAVDAIDIEIDTPIRDEVISAASGKTRIVSVHDFEKTPGRGQLEEIVEECREAGADIVKIAAMARCGSDAVRLLGFCADSPYPIVAIAMGDYGMITRVIAPLFGSLFTYACLVDAVAPGQMPLDDLVTELNRYFPGWRERNKTDGQENRGAVKTGV